MEKVRHLEVAYVWLQELARKGRIIVKKVSGELNPVDVMTKYLSGVKTVNDMKKPGFAAEEARTNIDDGLRSWRLCTRSA